MYKTLTAFFLLITFSVSAQSLPNTFKVDQYCEILPGDSIKMWYSCAGGISNVNCASFYRIGKIDPDRIAFAGNFTDYDLKGNALYKAQLVNGYLEGRGIYLFPNGNVHEMGFYVKDKRDGIWKYYYENGQLEKTLNFIDGQPVIIEQFDSAGKALVKEGNGVYTGSVIANNTCGPGNQVSGPVKNYKMDGVWKFNGEPAEVYDNGQYIKTIDIIAGAQKESAIHKPSMDISGYYANENARIGEGPLGCPGGIVSLFKYDQTGLAYEFYPELIKKIKSYPSLKQQCLIISMEFKRDKLEVVNIYSSKNDEELKRFVYDYLAKTNKWDHGYSASERNPPLFFAINIDPSFGDESVLIPEEYRSRKKLR